MNRSLLRSERNRLPKKEYPLELAVIPLELFTKPMTYFEWIPISLKYKILSLVKLLLDKCFVVSFGITESPYEF